MDNNFKILSLTLIGESRGEVIQGIVGVGSVIRARAIRESKDYEAICLAPLQFSCWNKNDPNYSYLISLSSKLESTTEPHEKQCLWVAQGIINGDILDNTNGATHYMTTSLYQSKDAPSWVKDMKVCCVLGNQIFLKEQLHDTAQAKA